MELNYFKYYKPSAIIPFVLIAGTLLSYISSHTLELLANNTSLNYYQFPSATILLGGLMYWIDKSLWKFRPFKCLFWLKNISGRYEGALEFNHYKTGEKEQRAFALEIEQTGSTIKLTTYFNNGKDDTSISQSDLITPKIDEFGNLSLYMNFHNNGNPVLDIPSHFGTNILEYYEGMLRGSYYTSKTPQTKGLMTANFVSNKLEKKF